MGTIQFSDISCKHINNKKFSTPKIKHNSNNN